MAKTSLSEEEMRRALGLGAVTAKTETAKTDKESAATRRACTQVVLSVRKDSGLPFRFVHQSSSVSKLVAQMEAEESARKQGYQVWALLDVEQLSG